MNRANVAALSALALSALALSACSPDFTPASQVDKLRVLAIKAEPPEIEPASGTAVAPDRAALTAFVLRADFATDPARQTTVLYLACVPTPGDPTPTPCVLLAGLRDPTQYLAEAAQASCAGGGSAPASVAFAGVEVCQARTCGPVTTSGGTALPSPEVAVPAGYGFDALPPGAPERILGVQAVVLAFALDATPDELTAGAGACPVADAAARIAALWAQREHVLATKRVWIRGPEAPDPPNQNPAVAGIGDAAQNPLRSNVSPGAVYLTPILPAGADLLHQAYTELDSTGTPIRSATEKWIYSWFSTAPELKDLHTGDGGVEEWDVASTGGSPAALAVVVRDLRGGVAWTSQDVTVGP